jgi:nicotinate-nucleotide adenylyltransferase
MSRRLGVLGGTFDPIHHGHLVAAQEALYRLGLDRVLFVPAGNPPHKPARPVLPAHHRLRMVELAIAGKPCFVVSRVDVDRAGPQYTADTLALLHGEWGPGASLFFVVGSDSLADMLDWHQPERIVEQCQVAVVQRPGARPDMDRLEKALPGLASRIHHVEMPLLQISSTDLRARVREGRPISYLVPPAVEAYIREQELYLNKREGDKPLWHDC